MRLKETPLEEAHNALRAIRRLVLWNDDISDGDTIKIIDIIADVIPDTEGN